MIQIINRQVHSYKILKILSVISIDIIIIFVSYRLVATKIYHRV